jgi:fumarate hydratase subunit alpha
MRSISIDTVTETITNLCRDANYIIGDDVINALKSASESETDELSGEILKEIIENHELAKKEKMAVCQDTGTAVFFIDIGQNVQITGGSLKDAVNEGVRKGYNEGCLRKSVVNDPVFERSNTNDNTPAVIHYDIVPGDSLKISFMAKGSGAENMSVLKMLKVSDGLDGVKEIVLETVKNAGSKPCPPIIVGVGVGGNFERCAVLSKKALLREIGSENPDGRWAQIEQELLTQINGLGIGVQGFGGQTTALAVHILSEPSHIASLPVAVNIQCHANRHKTIIL